MRSVNTPAKGSLEEVDSVARIEAGLDALDAPSARPQSVPRWRRMVSGVWPPVVGMAILIGIWQVAYWMEVRPEYVLPSPGETWAAIIAGLETGVTQDAIRLSMERAVLGFAISLVLGTVLGLALTRFLFMRRAFGPLVTGLQILPSVAWVPFAIMWFGLSVNAFSFVVIMGATPSIANGVKSGVDQIPTLYTRVGKVLGANSWQQIRYVILPASLPGYLAGLRQGWAFSWRSLMAAELIVASPAIGFGLGQILEQQRTLGIMPGVIATVFAILFVGILVELCFFAPLERRVLRNRGLMAGKTA